jgi:hypothetical protein
MRVDRYIEIVFILFREEIKVNILGGRNQLVELTNKLRKNHNNKELLSLIYGDRLNIGLFISEFRDIFKILEIKIEENDYSLLTEDNQENIIINRILEYFKDDEYSVNRNGSPIEKLYRNFK